MLKMVMFRHKKTTIQSYIMLCKTTIWMVQKNDDPNTSGNNMDGLQLDFNDDEDDANQDKDDDNINYLKDHMNIDNDTVDDIVADNDVND